MDSETIAAARALLPSGAVYADWAASALPLPDTHAPTFLPPAHHHDHSAARRALSVFLGDSTSRYHVIFTSGATAALHLLATRLPWSPRAALYTHAHSHNAVLGLRNPALAAGAHCRSLLSDDLQRLLSRPAEQPPAEYTPTKDTPSAPSFALLAYPAECNLTGVVYPLHWASLAKRNGLLTHPASNVITLLDTAKLATTSFLDLSAQASIDALTFSLYKLSATYTGLGALLVRRNSLLETLLLSTASASYFAGGRSAAAVTPFTPLLFAAPTHLPHTLELGTPNLQALHHLPAQLTRFSPPAIVMPAIRRHAAVIATSFTALLTEAFPPDTVAIHTDRTLDPPPKPSTIVSFSLFRQEGSNTACHPIGHTEIFTILSVNRIYARAGCMCNSGACAAVLGLSDIDVAANYSLGHRCGDAMDLLHGKPTGVVRVSFGWASLTDDAVAIVRVLRTHVCVVVPRPVYMTRVEGEVGGEEVRFRVEGLYVYPVKSCGGSLVEHLLCDGGGGAMGDRAFGIEDTASGQLINLRSCRELALISARYCDANSGLLMRVDRSKAGRNMQPEIVVDLSDSIRAAVFSKRSSGLNGAAQHQRNVTSDTSCQKRTGAVTGVACRRVGIGGDRVVAWLSLIIGTEARLVLLERKEGYMSNERNVLVVSKAELRSLAAESRIESLEILRASIRPNVILEHVFTGTLQIERAIDKALDDFDCLRTCMAKIVPKRGCTRCTVVNIIAESLGVESYGEPLRSISRLSYRKRLGGVMFGLLCCLQDDPILVEHAAQVRAATSIKIGQEVVGRELAAIGRREAERRKSLDNPTHIHHAELLKASIHSR